MTVEFRLVGAGDVERLTELFGDIDDTFFRPHPFTAEEARRIASDAGRDLYAILVDGGRAVAYGMLRGWNEGYMVPSLGIAVRTSDQGRGLGQLMMAHLHAAGARRGATVIRLRVHAENVRARRLYEALGYAYAGEDRGELVMLIGVGGEEPVVAPTVPLATAPLTGRLLDDTAPEWADVLRGARHDFYHLPAYAALSAAQEGGRPSALYVTDGSRALLLPLLIRTIAGGGFDATSPYGYPGPIGPGTGDPGFVRLAIAAGLQVLRDAGLVSVFVRLHPLLNPVPPAGIGVLVAHSDTVSVDLTLSSETHWAQTRENHRRDILRASRLGFDARMDEEWASYEAFKRLYRATMERRSALPFYYFADSYFDRLREVLGDRIHLCVVERAGIVAAAGLFVECGGIVEYHLSGSDGAFRNVQPTKLMIHFARAWAKGRGNTTLHLGGGVGGAADSLLQFKTGFSPLRQLFSTLRIVVDEQAYDRLVVARAPEVDARERRGFFPLYRLA